MSRYVKAKRKSTRPRGVQAAGGAGTIGTEAATGSTGTAVGLQEGDDIHPPRKYDLDAVNGLLRCLSNVGDGGIITNFKGRLNLMPEIEEPDYKGYGCDDLIGTAYRDVQQQVIR